jgi:deoxyribodipyrimidine photo-lyase
MQTGVPTLLLYVFEPSLIDDPHYSERHWRFVWQSLQSMNEELARFNSRILVMHDEVLAAFSRIQADFEIRGIYSYQEIGIMRTFNRDKAVSQFCCQHGIQWQQTPHSTVTRSASLRELEHQHWHKIMDLPCADPNLSTISFIPLQQMEHLQFTAPDAWDTPNKLMQSGGEKWAWFYLQDFFKSRGRNYQRHISRPHDARFSCARISPYLAWGNLSQRQVYQTLLKVKPSLGKGWTRPMSAFLSRIHWHDHFLQKFENECHMEFACRNSAYERYPYETDEDIIHTRLTAWQTGNTGIPIVDANMRAVNATGYINFRMRAMLVSVLTLHMNLDWRLGVHHLARQFLDFEPGIHYPQFQMQAGVTGMHTIRLYNPIKQSQEKDDEAVFLKKWLPELAQCPVPHIHSPWMISPMDRLFDDALDTKDYPAPVIDIDASAKLARERAWQFRERDDVRIEAQRLLRQSGLKIR